VLNAANEEAVAAFLAGTIRFPQIHSVNARTLEALAGRIGRIVGIDDLFALDARAREVAQRDRPGARLVITTVLAFVLTLGVLIVIHEYGHYRVAVACGVKVLRFSVGFGRVLWRWQKRPDATEFVVCALPLGGYVRMLDEREGGVAPEERDRAFNRKPLASARPSSPPGRWPTWRWRCCCTRRRTGSASRSPRRCCRRPPAGSLAEAAGLRGGDWVQAWADDDGQWVDLDSMTDLRWQATQAALDGRPLRLLVSDRDGRGSRPLTLALDTLPTRRCRRRDDAPHRPGRALQRAGAGRGEARRPGARAGLRSRRPRARGRRHAGARRAGAARTHPRRGRRRPGPRDALAGRARRARAGDRRHAARAQRTRGRRRDGDRPHRRLHRQRARDGHGAARPGRRPGAGAERTWEVSALTVRMLGRMLIGEASLKNLSGPLTIADYAGQSVQQGLAYYLGFLALVSVSLGVLNLLPLPMLDGGHLMYYLFEGVTGRPVSESGWPACSGAASRCLLMMMSVALFNDVARLLGLH
jgi:regulator of sigma E protease